MYSFIKAKYLGEVEMGGGIGGFKTFNNSNQFPLSLSNIYLFDHITVHNKI